MKGQVSVRHVARYLTSDGSLSVRLALRTRDVLDRSFANTSDETAERAGTVDVKLSRPRGTTFRIEADLGSIHFRIPRPFAFSRRTTKPAINHFTIVLLS